MCMSYLFNLVWLVIAAILVGPVLLWVMLQSVCVNELANWRSGGPGGKQPYVFNLTRYGELGRSHEHEKDLSHGCLTLLTA